MFLESFKAASSRLLILSVTASLPSRKPLLECSWRSCFGRSCGITGACKGSGGGGGAWGGDAVDCLCGGVAGGNCSICDRFGGDGASRLRA